MAKEWVCVPEMGTPSNLPARTLDVASKPPTWAYLLAENPPSGPCARRSPNLTHLGRRRATGVALAEAEGRQEVQDLVQAGEDCKGSAEGVLAEEELEVRRTPVLARLPVGVRHGDLGFQRP